MIRVYDTAGNVIENAQPCGRIQRGSARQLLLTIQHGLRCRFSQFELCSDFLDLRSLLLELLAELCDGRLQLLNCLLQLRAGTAHHYRLVPKSAVRQTNSNKSNVHGRRLFRRVNIADIGVIAFAGHACNICADIDVPVACRGISSRTIPNGRIEGTGGVVEERTHANGRVRVAFGVVLESKSAGGRAAVAGGVLLER